MTIRIMKFGMNKHVPHMNSHAKFQKLGFNSFGEIWFWIFSKMCNFGFFDIFQYEFKNRLANFSKMNLLIHMKCTNLIPKFQEGTITQKARKTFQSWQKKVSKFCIFGQPGLFGAGMPKQLQWSLPLSIQVLKVKAFLQAEFWIPASIFITVVPQKIIKKRSKNSKYVFFCHIRYSMTIRIMKFGMIWFIWSVPA